MGGNRKAASAKLAPSTLPAGGYVPGALDEGVTQPGPGIVAHPDVAGHVPMIRPEDRSAEPVVSMVDPAKVDEWKAAGWTVKEAE